MRRQVEKTCPVCGKKWETHLSDSQIHCSTACRGEAARTRVTANCQRCGKAFEHTPAVNKRFCSRACFYDSRKQDSGHRRCSKCGVVKHPCKMANGSWCKQCQRGAQKASLVKPAGRHKYAVNDARRRGLEWTLTFEQHVFLWEQSCHYCKSKLSDRGTGLDRLDNNRGYHPDNVVPCCGRCNRVRYNHFTYAEMVLLGETIQRIDAARFAPV